MRARLLAVPLVLGLVWCLPAGAQLQAGGLAPPPAVESAPPPGAAPPNATPQSTEQDLARADREDSGRGLEFVWLEGEVGVMHLGLATFAQDKALDPSTLKTTQTGLVAGAGLGVRLVFLTLGARFRYAPLPDTKLWTLGAEGGIHAPFGSLELHGALGLGYAGGKPSSKGLPAGSPDGSLSGFDVRLGGGMDYYFTNMFSLGANVSGDLMLLSRKECFVNTADPAGAVVQCPSGKSTAAAVSGTAVFGLHF